MAIELLDPDFDWVSDDLTQGEVISTLLSEGVIQQTEYKNLYTFVESYEPGVLVPFVRHRGPL